MSYEINIAKAETRPDGTIKSGWNNEPEYRHHFATHARSLTGWEETKALYKQLKEAFPKPFYQISVSQKTATMTTFDMEAEENQN